MMEILPELFQLIVQTPIDIQENVLLRLSPVLHLVCRQWHERLQRIQQEHPAFRVGDLALCGYDALLVWREGYGAAMNWNLILANAARGGHESTCRLAKKMGATKVDRMLACAARGGHESICRLAKEWGAINFNWMLATAAHTGHESLCRLAKEWGATDFDTMLQVAVSPALRNLAMEWGGV